MERVVGTYDRLESKVWVSLVVVLELDDGDKLVEVDSVVGVPEVDVVEVLKAIDDELEVELVVDKVLEDEVVDIVDVVEGEEVLEVDNDDELGDEVEDVDNVLVDGVEVELVEELVELVDEEVEVEVEVVDELVEEVLDVDVEVELVVELVELVELEVELEVELDFNDVVEVVVVVEETTTSSRYPSSWSINDTPFELVLLTPDEASHNINPPKLTSFKIEEVTYCFTVLKSA